MERMREVAERADLPVSEIVRRATENWLDRIPAEPKARLEVPTVDAGRCLIAAEDMRDALYE